MSLRDRLLCVRVCVAEYKILFFVFEVLMKPYSIRDKLPDMLTDNYLKLCDPTTPASS